MTKEELQNNKELQQELNLLQKRTQEAFKLLQEGNFDKSSFLFGLVSYSSNLIKGKLSE